MDCCTWFPEKWRGIETHASCCNHDWDVTHTYSLIKPAINFYDNLTGFGMPQGWTVVIVTGGTLGHLVKYPYLAYQVYKNRKESNDGKYRED